MLYENYQNKILKIAGILRRIFRHLPIIIASFAVMLAACITLTVMKGTVVRTEFAETVEYGVDLDVSASAFLSKAYIEYSPSGAEQWSAEKPVMPGKYDIRAVSNGAFGTKKYGKVYTVTVEPKKIDVKISASTVKYGDLPPVSAALVRGDTLVCKRVIYHNLGTADTTVEPDISKITILNSNGEDVTAAYVMTSVASSAVITPRFITVNVNDATHVYDGKEFGYSQYELADGELAEGDALQAVFDKTITDVGSIVNMPKLNIVNSDGVDVTGYYTVNENAVGSLIVEKRPLVITTGSLEVTYTGQNVSCREYTVSADTPLAEGHMLVAGGVSTTLNVGAVKNNMQFRVIDEATGEDKTDNYAIIVNTGEIRVNPRTITVTTGSNSWKYDGTEHRHTEYTVTGLLDFHVCKELVYTSIRNAGVAENKLTFSIFGGTKDVTANYNIVYEYGTLEVTKRNIIVSTFAHKWVYDGEKHFYNFINVSGDGLASSDIASVDGENLTYITDVGTKENKLEVIIKGRSGVGVDKNYNVEYIYGTLEVTPRPVTIAPQSVEAYYNGMPLMPEKAIITEGSLVLDHTFSAEITGSRINVWDTDVSRVTSVTITAADGTDVIHNYKVTKGTGDIHVIPLPIYVVSQSAEKIYDGTPLRAPELLGVQYDDEGTPHNALVEGEIINGNVTGSRTEVGTSENTFSRSSVRILRGNLDVTRNYEILKYVLGTLEVKPYAYVTVKASSAEKRYDGTPLRSPAFDYEVTEGAIADGHRIVATVVGSITEIGTEENVVTSVKVLDRNGKDVTKGYIITYESGKLTVKPIAYVTVTSGSASKKYDGKPLVCKEYTVTTDDGELLAGHTCYASVTGTITKVGKAPNTIASVYIRDASGRDVSAGYIISEAEGLLEIYEGDEPGDSGGSGGSGSGESGDSGDSGDSGSSGGSGSGELGGGMLGDILDGDTVIGRIKNDISSVIYLRMNSYGDYNINIGSGGGLWAAPAAYGKLLSGKYSYNYLASIAMSNYGAKQYTAQFTQMSAYMLPYYMSAQGNYTVPDKDTYYSWIKDDSYTVPYYNIVSLYDKLDELKGLLGEYSDEEEVYRSFVYNNYLKIDGETLAFMQGIISDKGFDAADKGIIKKVASYIQSSAKYNLEYDQAMNAESNVAVAFLRDYKEGVCVHYATAATLLYRALGIPARYVEGFMIETEAGKYVDITSPGHAWVEVYVDGIGWLQVEVTGGDGSGGGSGGSGGSGGDGDIPREIVVQAISYSKKYDGKPLYAKNEIEEFGTLKMLMELGYTYKVTVSGSQTRVGSSASTVKSFTLYDDSGKDVTHEFDVIYRDGKLAVSENLISIYLYETHKYYDGKGIVIGDGDYEIISGLADGAVLTADFHIPLVGAGEITRSELNADMDKYVTFKVYEGGVDVTSQYSFSFDIYPGLSSKYIPITIEPRRIELTAVSAEKSYDGKPLSAYGVYLSMGTLVNGDTFTAKANGSVTAVGYTWNMVDPDSVVIKDKNGKDVTENYFINLRPGKLTVVDPYA